MSYELKGYTEPSNDDGSFWRAVNKLAGVEVETPQETTATITDEADPLDEIVHCTGFVHINDRKPKP